MTIRESLWTSLVLTVAVSGGAAEVQIRHAEDGRLISTPPVVHASDEVSIQVRGQGANHYLQPLTGSQAGQLFPLDGPRKVVTDEERGSLAYRVLRREPSSAFSASTDAYLKSAEHAELGAAVAAFNQLDLSAWNVTVSALQTNLAVPVVGAPPWRPDTFRERASEISTLHAWLTLKANATETVSGSLNTIDSGASDDQRVAALVHLARLRSALTRAAAKVEAIAAEMRADLDANGEFRECRVLIEEEFQVATPRRGKTIVTFGPNGELVGDSSTTYVGARDDRPIFVYALAKGSATGRLQVESTVPAKAHPGGTTLPPPFRGVHDPTKPCQISARSPAWRLARVSHGQFFPKESDIVLSLSRIDGAETTKVGEAAVRVRGHSHILVNTGLFVSKARRLSVAAVPDPAPGGEPGDATPPRGLLRIKTQERDALFPALNVTLWPVARDSPDRPIFDSKNLIPGLALGIRIDDPTADLFVGATIEPIRGIQFLGGFSRGRRERLAGSLKDGDLIPLTVVSGSSAANDSTGPNGTSNAVSVSLALSAKEFEGLTIGESGWDWAFGIAFDVTMFAKDLIQLIGF